MKFPKHVTEIENSFVEDMAGLAERTKRWHDTKMVYWDTLEALDEIPINEDKDQRLSVSGGFAVYISASGDGKLLTLIVRALRTHGWMTNDTRPEKGASGWYADFYRFSKEPGSEGLKLPGTITLHFSSTVCRRVQVGTRMEEVPVYETQCDDLTIDEPEAVAQN